MEEQLNLEQLQQVSGIYLYVVEEEREGGMEGNYAEVQERIQCAGNKRVCNHIWKLIEKRHQLKVHLGERKQNPDCQRSRKTGSLDKVLLKEEKKKKKRPVAQ